MSRSGYTDDEAEPGQFAMWRGMITKIIRGRKGQAFLKELLAALDEMPVKQLITNELENTAGEVCALGALGLRRRYIKLDALDPEDYDTVARAFGINHQLIQHITYMNDDWFSTRDPALRWIQMREWVDSQIKKAGPTMRAGP